MGLWQTAGKADFAKCAEFISRFDPELRESLNRSESKVLQWLIYYVWENSRKAQRDLSYTSFSQQKVGEKFGRSRWTVHRALDKLEGYGLLSRLHRRPKNGATWQTNLYFLGDKLKAILARLLVKARPIRPCSTSAPQEFRKESIRLADSPFGSAASQDNNTVPEKPTWQPSMKLSELVKQLNPGRFTPKLAS